jgi:hypothetical protein
VKITAFLGAGIAGKSYPVTRQRRLNCYVENRPDGDKSSVVVYGTPGLTRKFALPAPARGLLGTQTGLYAVAGTKFYQLSPSGVVSFTGTISSGSGFVSMAQNPTQVIIVDGVAGYLYSGGALTVISAPAFPDGAKTVTFVGSYFVVEQRNTQQFWVSNVFDGSTWNSLAFASASQYSDNLQAVDSANANLILFSERHIEFWQNVGSTPQPFAPILSATSEYGLDAIFSRAHIDNSIIFLAHNPQGISQICRIRGYDVSVISTPDLDGIIEDFPITSDAVALAYVVNGHPMYQITFPSALSNGRTFLYDCSTGLWSDTQTGLTADYAQRHTANLSTYVAGDNYVSDYANGNIYIPDDDIYTDNGATILREIITRHGSSDFNVFTIDEVYLDMETGVGLVSGQGSDPQISCEVSKNNGDTFTLQSNSYIGKMGNYLNRVIWRRFGSARDFVFRFRMTDPVKFVITAGAISAREKPQ